MLRPASPLTVLLLGAFALLLISVVSTPIVKRIPLASQDGVDFGVFGFCNGSDCSPIEVGYSTDKLSAKENASFDLSISTRKTLSAILIVHPIAALFTLIMLIMAITAHFHSPSHSPRYLLCLFILGIFTFLLSLLSFLVDLLLFIPHLAWGSYIVLAATVLIGGSGIVSCAMRRTLVSRKARQKRIAENAEMSGENFYNRQAGATIPPLPPASAPMASGALGGQPQTASYPLPKSSTDPSRTSDERMPLTARTLSNNNPPSGGMPMSGGGPGRYGGSPAQPMGDPRRNMNGNPPRPYTGPRDEFGNPLPSSAAFGGPTRSRDPSRDSQMRVPYPGGPPPPMRGRGGPIVRGRGGFGPPRRGGYGPPPGPIRGGGYGPPPGRGGYGPGPNHRGGMMGPMAGGGRGPPPGYSGYEPYRQSVSAPASGYNGGYNRRPSDPNVPVYGTPTAQGYMAYPGRSDSLMDLPRAESPPPLPDFSVRAESPPPLPGFGDHSPPRIGQAVEMDATTGSPSHTPVGFGEYASRMGALRDSDADVVGMVGLQQGGLPAHIRQGNASVISSTSFYSSEEPYVPPPQAWGDAGPPALRKRSPLAGPSDPVELPATSHPPLSHTRQNSGDHYHEDVDPRFIDPELQPRADSAESYHASSHHALSRAASHASTQHGGPKNHSPPPLLLPGVASRVPGVAAYNAGLAPPELHLGGLRPISHGAGAAPIYDGADYDDMHMMPPGARSPAESEGAQSNFTSISQRGINPRWLGEGGAHVSNMPRRPPPRNDPAILLTANPDFELPGLGRGGRGGGPGRGGVVDALPRGGLIGGGRYPGT